MRNFKKRTIALVLASVVTVAGSFASERYKNSLMGLTFETAQNGSMSMVVQTKSGYSGNLTPSKRDANTYILTLPEMDSKAPTPDLTNNPYVQSVNIRTMPYTNGGAGYTRITVKTNNLQALPVQHRIFLPDSDFAREIERQKEIEQERKQQVEQERLQQERLRQEEKLRLAQERLELEKLQQQKQEKQDNPEKEIVKKQKTEETLEEQPKEPIDISSVNTSQKENNEAFLLILGVVLIIFISIYCYIKAKDKIVELSGESLDIDIKEDKKTKKNKPKAISNNKKKLNKIKNTIKTLDSTYAKSTAVQSKSEYTQPPKTNVETKPIEKVDVVDLDKLFQEQIQSQRNEQAEEDVENQALEDFLSGFSFDEEFGKEEEVKEPFDVELFEQIVNGEISFSKDDIECINKLMQTEIQDETVKNIHNYLVSNPIKKSKNKILEEIMTSYTISQDIIFTRQDAETLYKLINLEIDSNFVTDLRTNPERTKEVQKEIIEAKNKVRKPSEIATLKVSDSLPDLSEALRKQGNDKPISNYKPETVYSLEGFEVSTLSIKSELPDLSKEINNKEAYTPKTSEEIELVDNSYQVKTLSISSELPDLTKILQDPKSYETKDAEVTVADEKTLLESISKVEFKPFDDNSQNFEVLNDFDDFYAVDNSDPNDVLSFEEIAAEFEKLYSIKITNGEEEEKQEQNSIQETSQTFSEPDKDLIEQELASFFGIEQETAEISLDQQDEKPSAQVENITLSIEQKAETKPERSRSKLSEDVLNKIKEKRAKKEITISAKKDIHKNKTPKKEEQKENIAKICVLENESFDILSSVSFVNNMGCHLAKNTKGYSIIAYIGDKLFKIKTYPELKSEKIQARLSEKTDNGNLRYLVRIGIHKFILEIENENIKFVMDLC